MGPDQAAANAVEGLSPKTRPNAEQSRALSHCRLMGLSMGTSSFLCRSPWVNLAEAVRFELTDGCPSPVFKFAAELNRIKSLARFRLRNPLQSSLGASPVGLDPGPQLRRQIEALADGSNASQC